MASMKQMQRMHAQMKQAQMQEAQQRLQARQSESAVDVETGQESFPVRLAVYDLSNGWAKRLSPLVLCTSIPVAPHTGIIVHGNEYFWGGGIQKMKHEEFCAQTGHAPHAMQSLQCPQNPPSPPPAPQEPYDALVRRKFSSL